MNQKKYGNDRTRRGQRTIMQNGFLPRSRITKLSDIRMGLLESERYLLHLVWYLGYHCIHTLYGILPSFIHQLTRHVVARTLLAHAHTHTYTHARAHARSGRQSCLFRQLRGITFCIMAFDYSTGQTWEHWNTAQQYHPPPVRLLPRCGQGKRWTWSWL